VAEEFDPYHKWLGIPPRDQPPHHYRLLGVEPFEADPEVIDAAANRLLEYLQNVAAGPRLAAAQALMNEIAAARLCLLDAVKKAAYDKKLSAELPATDQSKAPPTVGNTAPDGMPPPPPPIARGPAVPAAIPIAAPITTATTPSYRSKRKKSPLGVILGLCLLLLVVGSLAVYVAVFYRPVDRGQSQTTPATASGESTKERPVPSANARLSNTRSPASTEPLEPEKRFAPKDEPAQPSRTEAGPVKTASAPPGQAELAKLIEEAEEALKQKNTQRAAELLKKYLDHPMAPESAKAQHTLDTLENVTSDEVAMAFLEMRRPDELLALQQGTLIITNLRPPLREIFLDTLKKNLPEFKRRQAEKGKSKE
jgi:hypothetical protein